MIDGASRFGFFWRVLLPLSWRDFVTVGVLAFAARQLERLPAAVAAARQPGDGDAARRGAVLLHGLLAGHRSLRVHLGFTYLRAPARPAATVSGSRGLTGAVKG